MIKYDSLDNVVLLNIFGIKIKITLSIGKFFFKCLPFILYILDFILPKDKNKIVFNSNPSYSDNSYIFYKYIQKYHKDKYRCIWIIGGNQTKLKDKNSFYLFSIQGLWQILTSKYIFTTHSNGIIDVLKYNNHIHINLWHGMPLKTLGLNEPQIDKKILDRYITLGKNSYMFATSDIFKTSMLSCFGGNYNKTFITGQARTDAIWDNTNDEKFEKIFNFSKYSKVVLYMPTYKEAEVRQAQVDKTYNNIFYMDDFNEAEFINFLEENNILFIMKPHPFDEFFYEQKIESLPKSKNFKILFNIELVENDLYSYEMFKFIDLMISDFSSVTLDYLILNRPVIYLDNLYDEYDKNRGMILEDNTKFFMPGTMVRTYKELQKEIYENLTNDINKVRREEILPLIHKYQDNKSCERIYNIMKEL